MNPSIKSLVTRPPGRSLLSRTVTDMPSFCNVIAALSPANPAPITITFLGTHTHFARLINNVCDF